MNLGRWIIVSDENFTAIQNCCVTGGKAADSQGEGEIPQGVISFRSHRETKNET